MAFGLVKSFLTLTLMQGVLAKNSMSSAIEEENPSLSYPSSQRTTPLTNKKRPLSQTKIDAYFGNSKTPKSSESQIPSTSSSQETISLFDENKENICTSSLQPDLTASNLTKEQKTALFKSYFRPYQKPDYETIKKKILAQSWPISKKGNSFITISADQSPDRKKHHIVITKILSPFDGETKYSAFIDGRPYTDFTEHKPLGHVWSPDLDSIKGATITIIYNKT